MEALDRNVFVVGEDANVVSIKDASSVKEPRNDSVIQRKSFTEEQLSHQQTEKCHSVSLKWSPSWLVLCHKKMKHYWIYVELIDLLKLSVPLLLSLIFQQATLFMSLIFVGSISNSDSLLLDSAALGNTIVYVTGIAVGTGLSSAADTLCSQAYGYKNYKRVGIIFQRGLLILWLAGLFIWCFWLNTESLLLLLQQPPCVAKYTGRYVQIFSLCLPGLYLFYMMENYLQSQGIVWPFIFTGVLTNILCAGFHAIFLYGIPLGINGAAVSLVLTNYCQPLILFIYIRIKKLHRQTWGGWSWESLKEWTQFYKLGLPGVALICLDWISFEISALVLGTLGEVELAINSVLINIMNILFMVPFGISIATTIRVGNELGAGNPLRAKRTGYVSIGLTVVVVIMLSIILNSIGGRVGKMYNVEDAVMERLPTFIHFLGCIIITDHIQEIISGILQGAGHQLWGAAINFVAFYVVGIPIGISLSLATELKSLGMWIGLACASFLQFFGYCFCMCVLNWKKESELAKKRAITSNRHSSEREEDDEQQGLEFEGDNVILKSYSPLRQNEENIQEKDTNLLNGSFGRINHDDEENSLEVNEEREQLFVTNKSEELNYHVKCLLSPHFKSHLKLLATHGSLFLIGAICCIGAGIVSMYHPPESIFNGNYSQCSYDYNLSDIYPTSIYLNVSPTP